MNSSNEHKNWITVGEIIKLIKTPVELYTDYIVNRWHQQLLSACSSYGSCTSPGNCQLEKKPKNLCRSCSGWHRMLESSHLNTNKSQIKWRQNCDTSQWPVDAWEIAKFFMASLGDNKSTVKDAKSTDLSSLLNVLEWMGNVSFCGDKRVDRGFVEQVRSEVRNGWAHAPNQEMASAQLNNAFDLVKKFLDDLEKVFTNEAVKKCSDDIQWLQDHGVTNVDEAELNNLSLLCQELDQQRKKHDKEIKELQDRAKSSQGNKLFEIGSCIPDKLQTFTGRDKEVAEILLLLDKDNEGSPGIVSIIGGPGFGKSTIAIEVSHRINENNIPVIFCYLSNSLTVKEVVRQLCLVLGIDMSSSSVDPMASLTFWLKDINEKVVLVMDNIEQLQQSKEDKELNNLFRSLRKDSKNFLQIIVTSTTSLQIPDLEIKQCSVNVMELESSIKLLKKCCPEKEFQQQHLQEMAELSGHVPLALRLVAFRLETDDPEDLIAWLKDVPMEALETPNVEAKVKNTIKKSFEMLEGEKKKSFVRLAIFPGNFDGKAASHVTELGGLQTSNSLTLLVRRSLLQQNGNKFMMHRLIRCFLNDESKSFEGEQAKAKRLMLEYYLKKCGELTKLFWEKDWYKRTQKVLKEDSHNIEEVLKFCHEASRDMNVGMVNTLVNSEIYKTLARFFYHFIVDVLSSAVVEGFLQSCIEVAKTQKDFAVVVNFQCLVADEASRISGWESEEYRNSVESLLETFEKNEEMLENNDDVKSHFYYCYGRYLLNCKRYPEAMENGEKCYQIRNRENPTSMEIVDRVIALHLLGMINKYRRDERNLEAAKEYFNEAIFICKEYLGCHQLTASSYKKLGDVVFLLPEKKEAVKYYREAVQIRKALGLTNNNKPAFNLLKNLGGNLWGQGRKNEASPYLEEAFALFDKLSVTDQNRIKRKYYTRKLREDYENWERTCGILEYPYWIILSLAVLISGFFWYTIIF